MFAVQSEEKSFLHNSRTLEKCMSWPGSRRKQDDTLLSVTVPAVCKEQLLLSALHDGLAQPAGQQEAGRSSEDRRCTEPLLPDSQLPAKAADASTAKRYE